MPRYEKVYLIDHNIEDVYKLIIDIESYPDFIPWCSASRIIRKSDSEIIADLIISFKIFTETYRSKVKLIPPKNGEGQINVSLLSGPLKHLNNQWYIEKLKKNQTKISFIVDFKFKSFLLDSIIGSVFPKGCEKMVNAFVKRADQLYASHK